MARRHFLRTLLLAALAVGPTRLAHADKLILIPTADRAGYSAEYLERTRGADEGIGTLTFPVGLLGEGLLRYNRNFDRSHNIEVGGMFQLLPLGYATPAVGVGVWDITNDGPPGRRAFFVVTQNFPHGGFVPAPLEQLQVTAGIGTGRLGGPFAGLRADLPARIALIAEWDSQRFNAGVWWSPLRWLTLKGELHNGNPLVGARLQAGF